MCLLPSVMMVGMILPAFDTAYRTAADHPFRDFPFALLCKIRASGTENTALRQILYVRLHTVYGMETIPRHGSP